LEQQLEARGYEVWVPQLPNAHMPSTRRYTKFLLDSGWDFQDNLLIGHSSGAVEILHLLPALPEKVSVRAAVLAGVFTIDQADDPKWVRVRQLFEQQLGGMFEEPLELEKVKAKAEHFLFVHGDNDPYCDPDRARALAQKLGGEYVEISNGQHFSAGIDPTYTKFPKLMELVEPQLL
jgi:predicted alpha/beta hydrolase family esterase